MRIGMLIFMLLVFSLSNAQTEEEDSKKIRLQLSAVPAFLEYDFGDLNKILKSEGLPQAKNGLQFTYAFKITDNTDYFAEGDIFWSVLGGLNTSKSNANGHSLEQLIMFGELAFGYKFYQKERHTMYAQLGYGGMRYNVDVHDNSNPESFSGALDEYGGSASIKSKNNRYISLAAGYDWAIDNKEDILLGLHLGYRIGLGKEDWEIKNRSYTDSPESSANGFFLGLALSYR